jgi:hypothetical protein
MDLPTRKIEFIREFLKIEEEDSVLRLEKYLKKEMGRNGLSSNPFSIEEFNERISKSLNDSEMERVTENSVLLNEIQKWH